MVFLPYMNSRNGGLWVTRSQFNCLVSGDFIGSKLSFDTYMSLRNPNWPV